MICELLFGTTSAFGIAVGLLGMLGVSAVLKKCGVKSYWMGFIPVFGQYKLSQCVGHEADGRIYFVIDIARRLCIIIGNLVQNDSLVFMLAVFAIAAYMIQVVYMARIFVGVCSLFGRKKRWVVLMMFFYWIILPYWGLNKKDQPQWQLQEVEEEVAEFFSSQKAEVMAEGLTVNL